MASMSVSTVHVLPGDDANCDMDSVPSSSRTIVRRFSFRAEAANNRYFYDPSSQRIAARRVNVEQ
jgi:hypothetical protein